MALKAVLRVYRDVEADDVAVEVGFDIPSPKEMDALVAHVEQTFPDADVERYDESVTERLGIKKALNAMGK